MYICFYFSFNMAQVVLRVENHHKMLAEEFYNQLLNGQFVDVMLAAAGSFIKAHRLVLAISSPYFNELFLENPEDHPVVMLKDVELSELWLLLQFMYCGEVKLQQKDLTKFLKVGAMLQVKGLFTNPEDKASADQKESSEAKCDNTVQQSTPDNITKTNYEHLSDFDEGLLPQKRTKVVDNLLPNSYGNNLSSVNQNYGPLETTFNPNYDTSLLAEDHLYRKSLLQRFQHECPTCHRRFSSKYNLKIHIRDKHTTDDYQIACELCHKVMRNPSCFRVHMHNHRKRESSSLAEIDQNIKINHDSTSNGDNKRKYESAVG